MKKTAKKNNKLFGEEEMGTIQLETIRLYEPEKKAFSQWKSLLEHCTVNNLKSWGESLILLLARKKIEVISTQGKTNNSPSIEHILSKKTKLKNDWTSFLAFFMAEKRNIELYIHSLSDEQVLLWKNVITNLYCSKEQFYQWTGKSTWLTTSNYNYFHQSIPIADIAWFEFMESDSDKINRYGYRERTSYFFLPFWLRPLFAPLFFPEVKKHNLTAYEELPEEGLKTFNGELTFLRYYPILIALYEQQVLCMGKTKMLTTTIKKVTKQLNVKEFFEKEGTESLNLLRVSLMLPTITLLFDYAKGYKKKPVEETMRNFEKFIIEYYLRYASILLPHVRGIKSSLLTGSTMRDLIVLTIDMSRLADNVWLPVDSLVDQLLIHPIDINALQIFKPYDIRNQNLFNNDTGEYICLSNQLKHLGIPYLKGFLYLMASIGLLEVAYREKRPDDASDFDTLQYFRLTELGKYAFKLIPTYTPPQNEEGELFHLDEQRLVIRSLKENNPYESLLNDTAIAIGNHRYMMSNESFLKNCRSEKDVKDKIDFFKRFISKDIPEVWTDFFDSLLRQCHPLKSVGADKYVIYQLDGKNKELIHLLSTDPLLKSIIIRAEGYKILVEKKQQKAFMDKLKAHGYLL